MIDRIIRSKRRTISLEITEDAQLVVRAPLCVPEKLIFGFVQQKEGWILGKKRAALAKRKETVERSFSEGEKFHYLGQVFPLSLTRDLVPLSFDGEFRLSRHYKDKAKEVFLKWYRSQAQSKIRQRLEYYSEMHGIRYRSFRITGAKRRWGSCGACNNLNFSWRLIMAPLQVLDYVVVHELVHVTEKNHSKRFWDKVASILPEHREHRTWLRDNGHLLFI